MIIESMAIQALHVTLQVLRPAGQTASAGQEFDALSSVEGWLTGFAMAALIISLILVFFLSANHKRSQDNFKSKINGLTAQIAELQKQITELNQQAPARAPGQVSPEESEELAAIQKS
jgi:hypothetical protein